MNHHINENQDKKSIGIYGRSVMNVFHYHGIKKLKIGYAINQ